jgi:hypothetical protein
MESARIMLETAHVVAEKLASCMKMKKPRDQVMRRCPRGSVVQMRRRTRKLDISIESQPAYVWTRRLTQEEDGEHKHTVPQIQSSPYTCEGFDELCDL